MYQAVTKAEFGMYRTNFFNGSFELTQLPHLVSEKDLLKQFISIHIDRKEVDVWHVKDEFEFALILSYHNLDFKIFLPEDIEYPTHVYIKCEQSEDNPKESHYQPVLLDYIIKAFGGYEKAKTIVANKPKGAVAYLIDFYRYNGYSFNSNDWFAPQLKKPFKYRICQLYPIADIRKAITFLRPNRVF